MELFAVVLFVLGLIGASLLRRHLREAKLLHLREITHKERMTAMEHSLPLPETNEQQIELLLQDPTGSKINLDRLAASSLLWIRLTALGIGLISVLGGIGTSVGMKLAMDSEIAGMWSMGLIPLFIGVGLLLFYLLTKGAGRALGSAVEQPDS